MSVTIYGIAKPLETSHVTVSRGLHDDPSVASATRKRIKLQAEKMGYQPNALSRAQAGSKRMTIGALTASLETRIAVLRGGSASEGQRVLHGGLGLGRELRIRVGQLRRHPSPA